MAELNLEKFNPTEAELRQIVEITQSIQVDDLKDKDKLEVVHKNRIALRDARNAIAKTGKALREDAVKFQKAVIGREKELIAIIEPEEERLKAIEDEAAKLAEREKRVALLPARRKMLEQFPAANFTDEQLLELDGTEFQGVLNRLLAEKNEADRLANEKKARELQEKEDAQRREAEMREREEKARQEERERAEREAKEREERRAREEQERKDREEREKKEAEERAAKEKEEAELRAQQEKERLERDEKYQAFLKDVGYDGSDAFYLVRVGTEIKVYKQVGTYNDGSTH